MSTSLIFHEKQSGIPPTAEEGHFKKIGNGAVKDVYKRIAKNPDGSLTLAPERVYYLSRSFSGRSEILGEVRTAQDIESRQDKETESHIQTDYHIDTETGLIDVPAAIGDLDQFILQDTSLDNRLDMAFQVTKGMHNMQKAGYVTGDAKLENILVFEKDGRIIVRLSDFGKARKLAEGEVSMIDGNPRFAGSEKVLTTQSEVFSTGLMMLRVLEEGLDPKLCEKQSTSFQKGDGIITRRGIEGLLIRKGRTNKKQVDDYVQLAGSYALAKAGRIDLAQAKREEEVIHKHIDELSSRYFHMRSSETPQGKAVLQVLNLIKDMTQADPAKRPTMQQAEKHYAEAMRIKESPSPSDTQPLDFLVIQD